MTSASDTPQNRVVAYIRKSTEDAEDGTARKQLTSFEYQREFVKSAVDKYTLTLVREPFYDDKTGYEAFVRDGYQAMLDYIRDHKNEVDGIICTEISRLARNFGDGGLLLWYMQSGLIKRIYTYSKVFTDSSTDQMMVAIELAMSKKSSDDTGDRTKQSLKTKALQKKQPPWRPILGYRGIGREGDRSWIIDENIGPLVIKVFEQFSTNKFTFKEIADYAFALGIKSSDKKTKTNKFGANTWRNRLTDKQYIGIFDFKDEAIVGDYQPLISDELFYKVQAVISGNAHPQDSIADYAYTKLMRCSLCGDRLSGTTKRGNTYYRCAKRREPCKNTSKVTYLNESVLEKALISELINVEIDQEAWEKARAYVAEINQPHRSELKKQIVILNEQIASQENRQNNLGNKFADNELSKSDYDRLMEVSRKEIANLRLMIVKLERLVSEIDELMNEFLDSVKYVTKKFEMTLPQNKRQLIDIFCENITWDGEKVRWDWKKVYKAFIKTSKNSTMLPG